MKKKYGILILILLLAALSVSFLKSMEGDKREITEEKKPVVAEDRGSAKAGEIDMSNAEEIQARLQEQADLSKISVKANLAPRVKAGKANWMLENTAGNIHFFQADVMVDGEVVYQSPSVYPGQFVQEDTVDFEIKEKTEGTILFKVFNVDTSELEGQLSVAITMQP